MSSARRLLLVVMLIDSEEVGMIEPCVDFAIESLGA
jgi:hypothetical protein